MFTVYFIVQEHSILFIAPSIEDTHLLLALERRLGRNNSQRNSIARFNGAGSSFNFQEPLHFIQGSIVGIDWLIFLVAASKDIHIVLVLGRRKLLPRLMNRRWVRKGRAESLHLVEKRMSDSLVKERMA